METGGAEINQYLRDVSDQPINKCLASALQEMFGVPSTTISAEKEHPFLNVRPDITITLDPERIICVEMFYTVSPQRSSLADYVLTKLNRYMKELEHYNLAPRLLLDE